MPSTWETRPTLKPEELTAWALTTVADALCGVTSSLHLLGTGDAGTTMGAIEFLAVQIHDGLGDLAGAIASAALMEKSE